jgi:hypothetical protein
MIRRKPKRELDYVDITEYIIANKIKLSSSLSCSMIRKEKRQEKRRK